MDDESVFTKRFIDSVKKLHSERSEEVSMIMFVLTNDVIGKFYQWVANNVKHTVVPY